MDDGDLSVMARELAGIPEDAIDVIRERLLVATRLIEQVTGRTAPASCGGTWPPMLRDFADILAQQEGMALDKGRKRVVLQPTARQVSMAEDALTWRRYVDEAQALAALNIWLRCKARRIRSWKKEAQRYGFAPATADRRLARSYYLIAVGLTREGKEIEAATRY